MSNPPVSKELMARIGRLIAPPRGASMGGARGPAPRVTPVSILGDCIPLVRGLTPQLCRVGGVVCHSRGGSDEDLSYWLDQMVSKGEFTC